MQILVSKCSHDKPLSLIKGKGCSSGWKVDSRSYQYIFYWIWLLQRCDNCSPNTQQYHTR